MCSALDCVTDRMVGHAPLDCNRLHMPSPANNSLSDSQLQQYHDAGFLLQRNLFDAEEIGFLRQAAKQDRQLDQHAFGRNDGEGGSIRLSLWNHPGHGIYGAFARCHRIVDTASALLRDEPYHYHSKMIMKDAKVGGAWAWHQDYGYWYANAVLTPNLVSAFIAVDPATKQNGCLQVIEGSHHCGRINHQLTGDQAGADPQRVAAIAERMPLKFIEMEPGDVLFFHSNLLHRSDQNRSDHPRWSMICCYNAKSNDPYEASHHPNYTPLNVLADDQIKQIGQQQTSDDHDSLSFLDPNHDASARSLDDVNR
ncbi:Phytanoyl-CoA dioxygenase (PhyH) [Stieleria bergensis]|uniref:Phytanoyl-CoA dioxygenase (PhyH) n=2 Tax=Stieleria bergensis TaxID=2528025 RepID=A0A517SP16_9BACT|nr:Phytanoyl-CoA dioxygenase (PhyH) [Planctomycetes bacterium SV_7m_r]